MYVDSLVHENNTHRTEHKNSDTAQVPRRGRGRPKGSRNKRRSGSRKPSKPLKPIHPFDSSTYDERKIKEYIRNGVLPDGWRAVRHQRGVSGGARTKGSYMTYLAPDNSRFRSLVAVYRFLGKLPPLQPNSSSSSSRNQRRRKRRKVVYNNGRLGCSKCRFSSNGCVRSVRRLIVTLYHSLTYLYEILNSRFALSLTQVRCRAALEQSSGDDEEEGTASSTSSSPPLLQVRSSDEAISFDSDDNSASPLNSSSEGVTCPQHHNLEEIVVDKDGVHCDCCDIPQVVGTRIRGCRLCDWDICESCCVSKARTRN